MAQRISTFDDWTDYFNKWQKDIGFDLSQVKDYKFDAFYADPPHGEIEFGEFKGRKKWEKLLDVPTQEMRDALMHLIVYQGDTEFASTEQQRDLLHSAPSEYDRQCLLRVMREEQRHGWQMSHVLVKNFGDSGNWRLGNFSNAELMRELACSELSINRWSISSNFSSIPVLSIATANIS